MSRPLRSWYPHGLKVRLDQSSSSVKDEAVVEGHNRQYLNHGFLAVMVVLFRDGEEKTADHEPRFVCDAFRTRLSRTGTESLIGSAPLFNSPRVSNGNANCTINPPAICEDV